jgi:DNA-binding NarL/FixJ family response regulator
LELAGVLVSLNRLQRARIDAEKACDELEKLGSRFHAGRAQALLKDIERRRSEKTVSTADPMLLTARQAEILRLIADGKSDRDIAATLGLSEHTVHRHVTNILNRTALPSRAAAVAYAVAHNLI